VGEVLQRLLTLFFADRRGSARHKRNHFDLRKVSQAKVEAGFFERKRAGAIFFKGCKASFRLIQSSLTANHVS